jgi:polyferredoxin
LKSTTWRKLRQLSQWLFFLLFLYLLIQVVNLNPTSPLIGFFYRLDPLLATTAMLAGRVWIGGFILAGITILLTLLLGRVWCGWICPLGSLLEWISPSASHQRQTKREPSTRWRKLKFLLLVVILLAALWKNQTLVLFDPLTLLTRTIAASIWPAWQYGMHNVESFLYQFRFLWPVLDWMRAIVNLQTFMAARGVFDGALTIALIFLSLIALNWVARRFWCRYLCPLGGLLAWLSRFALLRREVTDSCNQCGLCARICPTGTIDPEQGYRSDSAECTMCLDCLTDCKQGSVKFRWQFPAWKVAPGQGYDITRRELLAGAAIAAGGILLAGVEPVTHRTPAQLIRPPGALLTDFEELCIRCGECVRVCPTQGLQPSLLEGGWQNIYTPRLVPRLGYCAYDCSACTQVCPSGAIPKMTMDVKRVTPIGLASIDRDRCLPWAYDTPCLVCEEMCPLPEKAIRLTTGGEQGQGRRNDLPRPYILRDLCIGCGVCEYHCPAGSQSAIQVFSIPISNAPMMGL